MKKYKPLYTRMDIANAIAEAMEAVGMKAAHVAKAAGVSRAMMCRVLSGDQNLTVDSLGKLLHGMGLRFDVYISPLSVDEWKVKRALRKVKP